MSRVNLLPPDIRKGQQQRKVTSMVVLAGLAVVALILGFYVLQIGRLGTVRADIESQDRTNADLQRKIDDLQEFADLQDLAQQKEALLAAAYRNEVAFSGMLMDLSRITPSDSYLESFSAQIQGIDPNAEPVDIPLIGTIQVSGQAIGYDTIATWLTRLEQIRGWVNPWIPSVSAVEGVPDGQSFSASVDLTDDVLTERGRGVGDGG